MLAAGENWKDVRAAIDGQIRAGAYPPGARLPSAPELCRLFDTRRHSLRRALQALAEEGKIIIRQGSGAFVAPAPVIDYLISRRTRLSASITGTRHDRSAETLTLADGIHDAEAAAALGLAGDSALILLHQREVVAGLPLLIARNWYEAARFPDFAARHAELGGITRIFESYGLADYQRLSTGLLARPASGEEAGLLKIPPGGWVIVTRKLDGDAAGRPLAFGIGIWAADRVRFDIDMRAGT